MSSSIISGLGDKFPLKVNLSTITGSSLAIYNCRGVTKHVQRCTFNLHRVTVKMQRWASAPLVLYNISLNSLCQVPWQVSKGRSHGSVVGRIPCMQKALVELWHNQLKQQADIWEASTFLSLRPQRSPDNCSQWTNDLAWYEAALYIHMFW